MSNRATKILLVLITLALWGIALRPLSTLHPVQAQSPASPTLEDNEEVKRLCEEDQSDRTPLAGKSIDWAIVSPRDKARLKRVKELYTQNLLRTANDFDHAATVLQHGDVQDDFLLAHEFWVVAISKGKNDQETLSLAAA